MINLNQVKTGQIVILNIYGKPIQVQEILTNFLFEAWQKEADGFFTRIN